MGLILLVEPGYENMEYQLIILVLTRTQLGIALDVSPISSTSAASRVFWGPVQQRLHQQTAKT